MPAMKRVYFIFRETSISPEQFPAVVRCHT
jgi:hypothetical protein